MDLTNGLPEDGSIHSVILYPIDRSPTPESAGISPSPSIGSESPQRSDSPPVIPDTPPLYNLGVVPSLSGSHTYIYDPRPHPEPRPPVINYIGKLSQVSLKDQMNPLCHIGATLMEFYTGELMSPGWIHQYLGEAPTGRDLMLVLSEHGCCRRASMIAVSCLTNAGMDKPTQAEARQYRLQGICELPVFRLDDASGIVALQMALVHQGPVVMTTPVYHYGVHPWKPLGNKTALGGSAWLIVGYNDHEFIVRGAWGPGWGQQGHTTYPYAQYQRQYHWELHAAILYWEGVVRIKRAHPRDSCLLW